MTSLERINQQGIASSLDKIKARIEEGVAAALWPRLMQMSVFKHCKHSWKYDCDCEYCTRKRMITTTLHVDAWYDGDPWSWERFAAFASKRYWYKAELKRMRNEALTE